MLIIVDILKYRHGDHRKTAKWELRLEGFGTPTAKEGVVQTREYFPESDSWGSHKER